MSPEEILHARIGADARFHLLQRKRGRLSWTLASVILASYYGFILMIGLAPAALARPLIPGGAVTLGLAWGAGMVLLSIALTGFYTWWANGALDGQTARILADARDSN